MADVFEEEKLRRVDGTIQLLDGCPLNATAKEVPSSRVTVTPTTSSVPTLPERVLDVPTSLKMLKPTISAAVSVMVIDFVDDTPPKVAVITTNPDRVGTRPRQLLLKHGSEANEATVESLDVKVT